MMPTLPTRRSPRAARLPRRRLLTLTGAVLSAAVGSCVTGVDVGPPVNPVPVLESVQPTLLRAGQTSRTVQLVGEGFTEASEGTWNGQPRATEFVSASELRVTLEAADVASPSSGVLSVSTPAPGGGVSRTLSYQIGTAVPTVDSLSTDSAVVGAAAFQLHVFGTGFTQFDTGSQVRFDGSSAPTTFVSDSELVADIAAYRLARGAVVDVSVLNPLPGGGSSDPAAFTVLNAVPVLTNVLPDTIPLHYDNTYAIDLTGTGFAVGTVVWVDSVAYEPNQLDPTALQFYLPSTGVRGGRVWIEAPAPGGGVSNVLTLVQLESEPLIRRLSPTALLEGGGDQTLMIMGRYFAPDATVTWNGDTLTTVEYRGGGSVATWPPDTLVVSAPAALSATWGEAELIVDNPRGGGPSTPLSTAVVPDGRIALSGEVGMASTLLNGADAQAIPIEGYRADGIDVWASGQDVIYTRANVYLSSPGLFIGGPGVPGTEILHEEIRTPRLSRDGEWVFFNDDRWEAGDTIWRMRVDGTERSAVIDQALYPEPSPVRDELLYVPRVNGNLGQLTLLDLGTGTSTSLGVPALDARWSPDGEWIAYRTNDQRLQVIARDGTGGHPLGHVLNRYRDPGMFDWSPDGRFVLGAALSANPPDYERSHGWFELVEVATDRVLRFPAPDTGPVVEYIGPWRLAWYPDP